jgi:hypothetical protein
MSSAVITAIPHILACATCLPDKGSRSALAQGNAILFMLLVLGFVLSIFVYAIISFAIKQKRYLASQNPDTPHP